MHFARQFFKWSGEIEPVRHRSQLQVAPQEHGARAGTEPAFEERPRPVDNHFRGIEIVFRAEAVARRARSIGRIEAERARLELRHGNAAFAAGHFFGEDLLGPADHHDGDEPLGQLEGRGDGLLEAPRDAGLHQQAIDQDFDGVILALVEAGRIVERAKVAVNARAHKAVARELLQFLAVLAFSAAHDGREDHDAVAALGQLALQDGAHDLVGGLARDGLAAFRAVRRANGAVDHAQVIVDFGDGAHRRARRTRGRFLLDGDRRREALDGIHFRPLHLIQELPRVGGERFDVAALALGVNRVKCQRRFARAGKPGDDGQRVARNFQADVFEVVLARAPDDYFRLAHVASTAPTAGSAHCG